MILPVLLLHRTPHTESDSVPWYVRGKGKGPAARAEEAEARRKSAKAQLRKELQDPLLQMQGFLDTKRKKQELDMGVAGGMATRGGVAERLTQHQVSQNSVPVTQFSLIVVFNFKSIIPHVTKWNS